jgi:hypothetical protein
VTQIRGWLKTSIEAAGIAVLLLATLVGPALGARPTTAQTARGSSTIACGQSGIPLGAAGNYRILAATTFTNTGHSIVIGASGQSPGSVTTGFPPGFVSRGMDIADTAAANAQADLMNAYANASGRTNCPTLFSGNLGGDTLGPGLYVSSASLSISSGNLTLDAHGHRNAVFIIQISSKFTLSSGCYVILAGGARPANVYWVVGSSAMLGANSVLYGVILAHKSITMSKGATLYGRALAETGSVRLADSTVS